ncbi:D-glycero-beta-D-manno-heptose 1-phosphate adenylyltransferase [Thermodesulforhabdus norvegica]|nr:D-glycero-beta-D-manno-heptose 1-phosphate adenylyltransferase [Thermodesulforhabdus norvegica]
MCNKYREQGLCIVFTNGCFDILHPGHLRYLEEAKAQGDILIVGVNSDRSVAMLKGPKRPILDEKARAELVAGLHCVDFVTIFDTPDPLPLIELIIPDVLVKGADWDEHAIVGRDVVLKHGGRVYRAPYLSGYSTTGIIEKIRGE